jgi:fatty-acyl-CoA synthase
MHGSSDLGNPTLAARVCRANLAHFKAPRTVTFVKELPKTATGKIQKYVLRAQRTAIAPQ